MNQALREKLIADRAFVRGVTAALAVVHAHGQDTIFDEIVQSAAGEKEILKFARQDGTMRWSGLSAWLRRNACQM